MALDVNSIGRIREMKTRRISDARMQKRDRMRNKEKTNE